MSTDPADRRHPHIPFDPTRIAAFLRGRGIVSAGLMPAGKTNTNYKLVLDDGTAYVLRLYSRGSAEREVHVMGLVRHLVPVPRELGRGEGWSVFEFLEGDLLASAPQHSAAAAAALARIGSITFASRGWVNADGSISPFDFGDGGGFFGGYLDRPDVRVWIGPGLHHAIRALVQREAARIAEMDAECRLVHGDFNPTNVLVRDGVVAGVLDWEFSHAGTPYMDIGNLLRNTDPAYHPQIKLGLEAGGMSLPADWQQRAELLDLSSHLEFLTSKRSDDFKRTRVARIERCIRMFGG